MVLEDREHEHQPGEHEDDRHKDVDEHAHPPDVEVGLVAVPLLGRVDELVAAVTHRVDHVERLDVVRQQARLRVVLGEGLHDRVTHARVGVDLAGVEGLVPRAADGVLPRVLAQVGRLRRVEEGHDAAHGGELGVVRRAAVRVPLDRPELVGVVEAEDVADLVDGRGLEVVALPAGAKDVVLE